MYPDPLYLGGMCLNVSFFIYVYVYCLSILSRAEFYILAGEVGAGGLWLAMPL